MNKLRIPHHAFVFVGDGRKALFLRSEGMPMASPPRNSRNSHSEQTDEAPGLIETEEVEVERDIPADDNQPVERPGPRDRPEPSAFED